MFLGVLSITIVLFTVGYAAALLVTLLGLFRLSAIPRQKDLTSSVSIIIPVRNEEQNIGRCLDSLVKQDYPRKLLEIIVVDDHSSDRTAEVVSSHLGENVQLLSTKGPFTEGKKAAIEMGIRHSRGELIFTTDGDCVVPSTWIKGMVSYFSPAVGMVAGRTEFSRAKERSLFHRLQSLEFLGIVAAGAGAVGAGIPATCSGSNLAYRREAFEQTRGFGKGKRLVSGDDDILMQTIHKKTPWRVAFATGPETFVQTQPADNISLFLQQRARWASKCAHYPKKWLVSLLVVTFFYFCLMLFSIPFSVHLFSRFPVPLICFSLKAAADLTVVWTGCIMFRRRDLLPFFPLAEIFHIPYIVLVSIMGFFGRFSWKQRTGKWGDRQ